MEGIGLSRHWNAENDSEDGVGSVVCAAELVEQIPVPPRPRTFAVLAAGTVRSSVFVCAVRRGLGALSV